jgi:DNA-binding transcriptional ArsR family regulator
VRKPHEPEREAVDEVLGLTTESLEGGRVALTGAPCERLQMASGVAMVGWLQAAAIVVGRSVTQRSSSGGGRSGTYNRMVVSVQLTLDHDRIFGALGDATRRDIVRRAIDGEEGVAELAGHYQMSFAAVQKHVAVLERAGLVSKHRIGRRKVVRTNFEGLRVARRLLDRYEELWRQRVERMDQLLSGGADRTTTEPARGEPRP